jgi:hypothetical protein
MTCGMIPNYQIIRLSNGPEMAQDDLGGVNIPAGGLSSNCKRFPVKCKAFLKGVIGRVLPAGRVCGGLVMMGGLSYV